MILFLPGLDSAVYNKNDMNDNITPWAPFLPGLGSALGGGGGGGGGLKTPQGKKKFEV